MNKRINVMLPEETIQLIDSVSKKGERSKLVNEAIQYYIKEKARKNLREQLKEEAIAHAQLNKELASEWFEIETE